MNNNKLSANERSLIGLYFEGVIRVSLYIGNMGQTVPTVSFLDLICLNLKTFYILVLLNECNNPCGEKAKMFVNEFSGCSLTTRCIRSY